MAKFNIVTRETLGTTVYHQIRDAILNGDFYPDEPVKIKKIADEMGVSATPVRDALLQLVMERVLVMPSSREIRVPLITKADFHEIRTLRAMLEGYAAEMAALQVTTADIKKLEDLNARITKAFEANKPKQALSHNRAFHAYLYGIGNLPILEDVLDRLWLRMAPLIVNWLVDSADSSDFTDHHFQVIEALKNRDTKAAKQAIVDDIELGGQKIEAIHLKGPWANT